MNLRFLIAITVSFFCLTALISSAVQSSKKLVVTVAELSASAESRDRIRLGARVVGEKIEVSTTPERLVVFQVADPGVEQGPQIEVRYAGAMPDTLKVGRDVILEGAYRNASFHASSLMTQCPSKYEPPTPEGETQSS